MPRITEKDKRKEGRGKGHGADYKPWIKAREFNSMGTAANVVDWKHGRTTQLLSQGEEWYYYVLRWDDNVTDYGNSSRCSSRKTRSGSPTASVLSIRKTGALR